VAAADAAASAPLLDNFSKLMNHLIFTGLEKRPALKMAPQTDHSSALMVPAGSDKLRDIGRPRGQVDDNIPQVGVCPLEPLSSHRRACTVTLLAWSPPPRVDGVTVGLTAPQS
jgi:hypothetical protein